MANTQDPDSAQPVADELRKRIGESKYDSGLDGWWAGRVEKMMIAADRLAISVETRADPQCESCSASISAALDYRRATDRTFSKEDK